MAVTVAAFALAWQWPPVHVAFIGPYNKEFRIVQLRNRAAARAFKEIFSLWPPFRRMKSRSCGPPRR
jgi:hypothetical protein